MNRSIMALLSAGLLLCVATTATAQRLNPDFESLIDRYLAEFHGVGDGPSMANDGSAAYFENRVQAAHGFLDELRAIDRATLTFQQDIDYRYLEGLLESRILDGEQVRQWEKDPNFYLRIEPIVAPNGGLLYRENRPVEERAAAILEIMKTLPTRMENAQQNLQTFIPLWLDPARNLLAGAIATFEDDVRRFADRVPEQRDALLAENERVLAALREFGEFLDDEWPTRPEGEWRVGKDVYNARLRSLYQVGDMDAQSLYEWGRKQYTQQLRVLDRAAARVGDGRSWRQIAHDLQQDYPSAEEKLHAFHREVRRGRPWLIEHDLVSIPWDEENAAAAIYTPAYYNRLTFTGFGGAPRARESTFPGAVMLAPIDPDWSTAEKERFLSAKHHAFITVLMTHEVYPGHALVALYDNHNPRKLRTYESSYSNQGWAYYVEWVLTPQFNYYPPERQREYEVEMERLKLWRYARVIYDAGMHLGHVTVDEAVDMMTGDVMFDEYYSFLQVQGATHRYVSTGVATLGYHEFMALRDEYFTQMYLMGRTGTLKDLHDRVLKIGSIPYALMREALLHDIRQ